MADHKDWERLFKEADKNGNGYLTAGELAKEMKRIGYPGTEAKIKGFLCAADTSGDRQLSAQEFMDAMESAPTEFHIAVLLHSAFTIMDRSGDGSLSAEELRFALVALGKDMSEDEVAELVAKVDKDGSGSVSLREFVDGVQDGLVF